MRPVAGTMSYTCAVKAMVVAGVLIIAKQCAAVSFGDGVNSDAEWHGGSHKWCNNNVDKHTERELKLAIKGRGEECQQMCIATSGCVCAQWNSNSKQCWARAGRAGPTGLQSRGESFLHAWVNPPAGGGGGGGGGGGQISGGSPNSGCTGGRGEICFNSQVHRVWQKSGNRHHPDCHWSGSVSADTCKNLCLKDSACTCYMFDSTGGNECWTHTGKATPGHGAGRAVRKAWTVSRAGGGPLPTPTGTMSSVYANRNPTEGFGYKKKGGIGGCMHRGNGQWLQLDFRGVVSVSKISSVKIMAHESPRSWKVEYSTNGHSWTKVGDFNGDGEKNVNVQARYVRAVVTHSSGTRADCLNLKVT